MTLNAFLVQLLNGLVRRIDAVPRRRRAVADLRRHADRQLRARLVLHARHLRRVHDRRSHEPLAGGLDAWFWPSIVAAALGVGVVGALVERLLLRRIYRAPELFQLLATFALMLVVEDAVLYVWGPEDLLGPRAPGFGGAVDVLGRRFPTYDLLLIVVGPLVLLGLLWLLLTKTRWGTLVRAATAGSRDGRRARRRPGVAVHRRLRARDACLAGLGGALQLPREPANARPRPRDDRRRVRRRGRRRHGLDPRRVRRRAADRRDQGDLRRHRHRRRVRRRVLVLEADARRRVPRDGRRARRAAVGAARPAAGAGSRRLGRRGAAAARRPADDDRGARAARRARRVAVRDGVVAVPARCSRSTC